MFIKQLNANIITKGASIPGEEGGGGVLIIHGSEHVQIQTEQIIWNIPLDLFLTKLDVNDYIYNYHVQ